MSENSKTDGARTLGTRVRDWFNGGDPDGRAKLRAWATGDDGRWRGYTHSMGKYVTWLMVIACILYPFTRGIGSILALLVAIFLMGGRAMIERQVRHDISDLEEANAQLEQAQREYDLNRAAELQYGRIPELKKQLEAEERIANEGKARSLLRDKVTEEEIARIIQRWTGIPVARLMEGEREKLLHLEEDSGGVRVILLTVEGDGEQGCGIVVVLLGIVILHRGDAGELLNF